MHFNIFFLVFMFFCFNSLCHAVDISVKDLIRGVNQARLTIQSGEIRTEVTIDYAAKKSEKEITEFIKSEREKELSNFTPNTSIGVKEFEKKYLMPHLNFHANWYRQHTSVEHATTLFQVLDLKPIGLPELYQYKLTMTESPESSLDSEAAKRHQAGIFSFCAYDTHTQVVMGIGDIIMPKVGLYSVDVYNSDISYGYSHFSLFGRSPFRVPTDVKSVGIEHYDGTECQTLAFTTANKQHIKLWVDVSKDFCVRKIEYPRDSTTDDHIKFRIVYKKFQRFKDVWYPTIKEETIYDKDGKVESHYTTRVTLAEFNVDFPKDFFKINKKYFRPQGAITLPETGMFPISPPEEEDKLLLLCGPQSLLYLCEYLKIKTNLHELKKLSGFDPNRGTTMKGLKEAATYKGLSLIGVRSSLELLKRRKVQLPAIAYVDSNHFLVFESVDKDGVKTSDPAKKHSPHLTWDEVSEIWSGELLIFNKMKGQRIKQKQVPLALVDAPVYDFGKVLGGSEIKHTFSIKNIGQKPLTIVSITETCACTASILSQDKILPGETGKVSSVLQVPSGNHRIQENILVHTDDPIQNTLQFTLTGEAYLPLTTFPEHFAIGTHNPLQKPLEKRVSLHLQEGVKIIGVKTDSEHMKAALYTDQDIPMINLQLLKTLPIGKFRQHIFVDYEYKGKKATHKVYIYGDIIGDLHITPNRLFFGLVKDTSAFSKTITISSRDTEAFEITSTESSTESVKVTFAKEENETSYKLNVTIAPEAKSGEVTGEVVIHTSSVDQPTLRVPFFGVIAEVNVKR